MKMSSKNLSLSKLLSKKLPSLKIILKKQKFHKQMDHQVKTVILQKVELKCKTKQKKSKQSVREG
jgi:hypothetical protein